MNWLEESYNAYPRIEESFEAELDKSLGPRGPDMLYDIVGEFGLAPGSLAVDVGCGEGTHSLRLAERFGLAVVGVDPVQRHIDVARSSAGEGVRFVLGSAESLPLESETAELVWCRDVLVHVADLPAAYAEFARVLRPGGRALVYQMFAGELLEPREADFLRRAAGVVSGDPAQTDAAIAASGLRLDERIELGTEWGEWNEEQSGKSSRKLLHAARLLRERERFVAEFGQAMYEIKLGDCLWHVYGMIGKLDRRVYVLSRRT
jgi:SAM-dependent methyltransferase